MTHDEIYVVGVEVFFFNGFIIYFHHDDNLFTVHYVRTHIHTVRFDGGFI